MKCVLCNREFHHTMMKGGYCPDCQDPSFDLDYVKFKSLKRKKVSRHKERIRKSSVPETGGDNSTVTHSQNMDKL